MVETACTSRNSTGIGLNTLQVGHKGTAVHRREMPQVCNEAAMRVKYKPFASHQCGASICHVWYLIGISNSAEVTNCN